MKKIRRDGISRRPQSVIARLSLIGVALALAVGPGVRMAAAQTPEEIAKRLSQEGVPDRVLKEWLESLPKAEDIKLADDPELEIYKILPSAKQYDYGARVVFLVGARNLGKASTGFDYALSLSKSNTAPWEMQKGVELSAGDLHFTGFVVAYDHLVHEYLRIHPKSTGKQQVCPNFWLVKQGTKDLYRDPDMPNHQKQSCVTVMIPIE